MSTIHVTSSHIIRGKRLMPCKCPVALAIREQYPHADIVIVTPPSYDIFDNRNVRLAEGTLPEVARAFAMGFDSGRTPKPITFSIP